MGELSATSANEPVRDQGGRPATTSNGADVATSYVKRGLPGSLAWLASQRDDGHDASAGTAAG